MASEWRSTTWGDEIALEYGKAIRGYSSASGKYRVFGSNGPIGWHSDYLAEGPGIILGRKGAYRGVRFSKAPFFVIDTAYYVRPKTALDMRWLYYAIIHHQLGLIDDGSPIPSTTRAAVYVRGLDVPPIDEQVAIATTLGLLDDKIELITESNRSLERIAGAIYRSWFVDFDLVRAKTEGRESEGIDAATAALFPEMLCETQVEQLPNGWTRPGLGSISQVGIGKTPPRGQSQWFSKSEDDVVWVSIRDMGKTGKYIRGSSEYLTREAVERFNVRVVPDNTVIVSFKLTVGRLAITDGALTTNEAIAHCVLPDDACVSPEYLYCALSAFDFTSLASTSSIAEAVNSKTVRDIPVTIPSSALMNAFSTLVYPIFQSVKNNQRMIETLRQVRDALLPRLISGKLRVPEAEKLVEALL